MTVFPLTRDAALDIIGRYHRHNSRQNAIAFAVKLAKDTKALTVTIASKLGSETNRETFIWNDEANDIIPA